MDIVINGENIENKGQLHKQLKEKLSLPDYYGENLDALMDCLTGWIDVPTRLVFKSFDVLRSNLGEYADLLLLTLRDAENLREGLVIEVE